MGTPLKSSVRDALFAGAAVFAGLAAWLSRLQYSVSPESLRLELLARALGENPPLLQLKREFAVPGTLVHAEWPWRPVFPFLLKLLDFAGLTDPHRSAWLTAFFLAATVPAWAWALDDEKAAAAGHHRAARVAAALAPIAVLLLAAENGSWAAIAGGTPIAAGVFFFALLYGFYLRRRHLAAGVLGALMVLSFPGAELFCALFALAHLAGGGPGASGKKRGVSKTREIAREAARLGGPAVLLSVLLSFFHPGGIAGFGLGDLGAEYLKGAGASHFWFADSDSALHHGTGFDRTLDTFDYFVRQRWTALIQPYSGRFLLETALPGLLGFIVFLFGYRRPAMRTLTWATGFGVLLAIVVAAGWTETFSRPSLLFADALIALSLARACLDESSILSWAARAGVGFIVILNLTMLQSSLQGTLALPSSLLGEAPAVAQALTELDAAAEPALCAPAEGEALAYLTRRLPLITLPDNHAMTGTMDAFVDRWKIRWTTVGMKIGPELRTHELIRTKARNGIELWEIRPLRGPG